MGSKNVVSATVAGPPSHGLAWSRGPWEAESPRTHRSFSVPNGCVELVPGTSSSYHLASTVSNRNRARKTKNHYSGRWITRLVSR